MGKRKDECRYESEGRLMIRAVSAMIIVLSLYLYLPARDENGWNGIVPIRSTRVDVEKRYGTATAECHCVYSTANETINIDYSKGPCQGPPYGWDVPLDTVLRITVYPKVPLTVSESELIVQKYVRSHDTSETATYYTNIETGIRYAFQHGRPSSISYIPSSKDIALRCAGFPPYEAGIREYHPYSAFLATAPVMKERLNDFGFQLASDSKLKGYIIVYAAPSAKEGEATAMGENAKRRLTKRFRELANRLVVINGGRRDIAQYELFLIPSDMPAPSPTPTIASKKLKLR